jgi:spectinomycin phosphotransferase
VRERPTGIRDHDVAAALARQWPLTVERLSYLPVGFGGYHWLAVDKTGSRWFVTVSELNASWVPDLPTAMQSAAWLATEANLEFVVAPIPTTVGQVVAPLGAHHALTLFPYLDAAPANFDDPIDDTDRAELIDMLARLHTAPPSGIQLPGRPLDLSSRQSATDALASLDTPWTGGPYSEPGRDLLTRHQDNLSQAFARFDALLKRVQEQDAPHVITHGEPHPGNLLRTPAGLRLIDWDSVAIALPERDLWCVVKDDQDIAQYTQRTGRPVNQDALALYRLRWSLDEIAEYVSQFRAPHQETADTLISWTSLQEELESIAKS